MLIIGPTQPDAMYVGNYYPNARDIPRTNALYMHPTAPECTTFAADDIDVVLTHYGNVCD